MKVLISTALAVFSLTLSQGLIAQDNQKLPKKYTSSVITKDTEGHQILVQIDIKGAKQLVLEVTDGGNGTDYDWADWIEPTLIGPKGSIQLTEIRWQRQEGQAVIGKNYMDGPLIVNGKEFSNGIGVHARSVLVFKLPQGYETFKAIGGLDHGGISQEGSTTSVQFHASTSTNERISHSLPGFEVEALYDVDIKKYGSWVALTVDGKGRLIASDRHGPLFRIVVPEIGDEKAETKVEKLQVDVGSANGLLEAFGSLYVVGKGSGEQQKGKQGLFRLTDTNNDDQYDKVEFLVPLKVGADHHAHNVLVHPDGKRLVILSGNNTDVPPEISKKNIRNQLEDQLLPRGTYYGHNTNRKAPGGFVLICEPDGSNRRLHSAGFRNPYDFAYNLDGELFTWDADMEYDIGGPWYRPTRVNHTVSGADFGWRWGAGKWPEYFPDTVGTVVDIGRGSPTGSVFGYGAKFPAKYQKALYVADWTYGRMFAVHLTPKGATYTGTAELFVQGRGMPISEVIIRPQDGAMYYITGGRRQKSALFRVTYTGKESTRAISKAKSKDAHAKLRQLRKKLESFHGEDNPEALKVAWPYLSHSDRFIRFAARTAIEHQPSESWIQKALDEKNPISNIELAVAIARTGDKTQSSSTLQKLNEIQISKLPIEQKLDLLRAYSLIFIRLSPPDEETKKHLIQTLDPLFPSRSTALSRELCQMLLYLGAPKAISKSVDQLLGANSQADQMFYSYHLRTIQEGWTPEDRGKYFSWIGKAQASRNDYVGGGHFNNFLKLVQREASKGLNEEQKKQLQEAIAKAKSETPKPSPIAKKFVREWTLDSLKKDLHRVDSGRTFIRGKKLSEALCSTCHLFNGKGGAIGPDLTSVGNKMNAEALLLEVLDPSRVISEQHASSELLLSNGTRLVGREVGSDDKVLRFAVNPNNPEEIKEIKKEDIISRKKSDISMMPKGLLNVLQKEEILDLFMYLLSGGKSNHIAFDR